MECSSLLLVVSLIARIQLKIQMRNTIHMGNTDAVSCTGDCTVRNFIVIPNISLKVAFGVKTVQCKRKVAQLSGNPRSPGSTCYNITKKSERRYDSSYCMLFETLSKYLIEEKNFLFNYYSKEQKLK